MNIIYVLVDDSGYGDINLEVGGVDQFSNPYIKTPNLSRFAKVRQELLSMWEDGQKDRIQTENEISNKIDQRQ